ncbi:sigma-70 family RNA polymerase sigma factor [Spirillospora sp. NBC_00431]
MDMDGETVVAATQAVTAVIGAVLSALDEPSRAHERSIPPPGGRPVAASRAGSPGPSVRMAAMLDFLEPPEGRECLDYVVRHVQRLGPASKEDAEDAAQHALLQLWQRCAKAEAEEEEGADQGRPIDNPRAWMCAVALKYHRRSLRRRLDPLSESAPRKPAPGTGHDEPPGHDDLVAGSLDADALLGHLAPHDRKLLIGRMLGIPIEDIAERLGIERREVEKRLRATRGRLRKSLPPRTRPDADAVVNRAELVVAQLEAYGGELRTMATDDRQGFQAEITELRRLLSGCRAGRFGTDESEIVLGKSAVLAEALIVDRDERTGLALVRAASRHLRFLKTEGPEAFRVRRVLAEAHSELGRYRKAEQLLRKLAGAEKKTFRAAHPRTELLLYWTLIGQGRLDEAEEGFDALMKSLAEPSAPEGLALHALCRNAWLLGRLGRTDEAVRAYTRVVSGRTRVLRRDHPDTLDARHSPAKALAAAGMGERALALLDPLLDTRARVQGDRHPDALETLKYRHVARVQVEPRDERVVDVAFRDLREILHVQIRRHGPGHPMCHDTRRWLTWLDGVRKANRFGEPVPPLPGP